jgi:hypothetical protein
VPENIALTGAHCRRDPASINLARQCLPPAGATDREWRFLQLTALLAGWMLLSPLLASHWLAQVLLQALFLNSLLVTLWANPQWRISRRLLVGLWLVSLASALVATWPLPEHWARLAHLVDVATNVPLLVLLAVGTLQFVFRRRRLTSDGVFATIVVYLLIAFLFAQLYLLMIALDPGCFSLPVPVDARPPHLLQLDLLYFSFVTLATVGYGDILPTSETARMLAMIEAVVGQFYVAVIVAVFVGMYSSQRRD